MPKKIKTRKQKIRSNSRRQAEVATAPSPEVATYSVESLTKKDIVVQPTISVSKTNPQVISTSEYGYLSKDLFKTIAITGTILIAEIILQILIKGRLIIV